VRKAFGEARAQNANGRDIQREDALLPGHDEVRLLMVS
jgi:hypothetical protein